MQNETTEQSQPQRQTKIPSGFMQECIEDCLHCFQSCTELVSHCLSLGGKHAEPSHISIIQSCGIICEAAAKLMMIESDHHPEVCKVCSEICLDCADECESTSEGDQMMIECAEACRTCAESCSIMSAH